MHNPLRSIASALLLATLMLSGHAYAQDQDKEQDKQASVESIRKEVRDLNQELADFTAEKRDKLMKRIDDILASIDTRIARLEQELEEDWQEMDQVARAEARTALASLRRERARVAEWYQRMEDSSDFTWESMKEGFNDAFSQLSEAWQSAEKNVQQAAENGKEQE